MNLLAHRIADIIFEEGGRHLVPEDQGGRARVETALARHLEATGVDPDAVTVDDFRLLSQEEPWTDLMERLVPADTRDRVTDRFERLVFR